MHVTRTYEENILHKAINSKRAELGIVYGRRRIGKSTLLKKFVLAPGDLYFEGVDKLTQSKQIKHFLTQLAHQTKQPLYAASTWEEVFHALTPFLKEGRHYIVFDELPWMAGKKSQFISYLKYFWDNHWKQNPQLTLVLCGSIANFMVKHVIHSEALHNRKTFEMKLDALSARESSKFFEGLRSDYEVSKFLMVFGGVPKYLEQIQVEDSLEVNLDRLCFSKSGFFVSEFETLFKEQFKTIQKYNLIVKSLKERPRSKEEIAEKLRTTAGGGLTSYLENLERAEFVKCQKPVVFLSNEHLRTKRYLIWDEWLRFYFTYMEPNLKIIKTNSGKPLFSRLCQKSLANFWGLSFERLCLKNIDRILEALQIPLESVIDFGPFFRQRSRSTQKSGVQIDILLYRQGMILTLIECKFTERPIGTEIIAEIQKKIELLSAPRIFSVERVLISANGITPELEQKRYFHKILGLESIF